jgi:hypothetical protein
MLRRVGCLVAEEAKTHGLVLDGGVFNRDGDGDVWFFSCGDDVTLTVDRRGDVDLLGALDLAAAGMRAVQHLFVPKDPRFRRVLTETRGHTIVAAMDIARDAVIGVYHGYIRHKFQASNPCYNGPIAGSEGVETIDPTLGDANVRLELNNVVVPFLNEPPTGNLPNCLWQLRPALPALIRAARNITAEEELFLYYGTGYPRTYSVEEGLLFQEVAPDALLTGNAAPLDVFSS